LPHASARLALGMLAASLLLCTPIALWGYLSDGAPLRTIAVAIAANLLTFAAVRKVCGPREPARFALDPLPADTPPSAVTAPLDCGRPPARRSARTSPSRSRTRAGTRASSYRQTALRPARAAGRIARDVRCPAAPRRRTLRRRSRP
jgi:hypothetical protein